MEQYFEKQIKNGSKLYFMEEGEFIEPDRMKFHIHKVTVNEIAALSEKYDFLRYVDDTPIFKLKEKQ
jgi:hypothetical protein